MTGCRDCGRTTSRRYCRDCERDRVHDASPRVYPDRHTRVCVHCERQRHRDAGRYDPDTPGRWECWICLDSDAELPGTSDRSDDGGLEREKNRGTRSFGGGD